MPGRPFWKLLNLAGGFVFIDVADGDDVAATFMAASMLSLSPLPCCCAADAGDVDAVIRAEHVSDVGGKRILRSSAGGQRSAADEFVGGSNRRINERSVFS